MAEMQATVMKAQDYLELVTQPNQEAMIEAAEERVDQATDAMLELRK